MTKVNLVAYKAPYASMASAKRGAKRGGLDLNNVVFDQTAEGIQVLIKQAKPAGRSERSTNGPVAKFRKLFEDNYGKLARKDVLALAVENGIKKNTAATYYQKLAADAK